VPATKRLDDVNAFAQGQYQLLSNFDIVGGMRYTRNSQFGSALTPKLTLMYSIAGFKFRGGVGAAFRAPSIKELYYDFDHQGMFWVYGNPGLKPEKGLYTSLSAEYTKGSFNASVSGYHNKIGNKITQYDVITAQGMNEKYYKNVSSATLQGIDISISYVALRELTLKANYSYCDAIDNSTGLQLESNVKHSETLSATWNGNLWKSPFSLQLAGRLNSPKLYQQMTTGADGNPQADLTRSKPYSIWKVALVKPFSFKDHTVELTAKVDNIFNFQETSFINPGRQYLLGLRYNFKY
jgi:outer membrane receptor for ferrienterochelin and colicins